MGPTFNKNPQESKAEGEEAGRGDGHRRQKAEMEIRRQHLEPPDGFLDVPLERT